MASELQAAAPPEPPSIMSTTTTTATGANGTTNTTNITVSAAANGTTTTVTTAANGNTTTISTTTTTTNTSTSTDTTISSLSDDDLREIFLRLPDLPALVRAALTCRSWLGAVRSSPPFRRMFRALHHAPLIGLFLDVTGNTNPFFVPLRLPDPNSDSDVTAALRRGDFFLTPLPHSFSGWTVTDCRDGCILLWNKLDKNDMSLAMLNPMTWAVDILPLPGDIAAESRRDFGLIGFQLQSSDENPFLFRVICVCAVSTGVRVAIFSSETRDWVIQPWVDIGGDNSLKFKVGSLVNDSIYWPCHGEGRMIRINTDTLDITDVDLPGQVEVDGFNFQAGETKDGDLCIVYQFGLFLNVWIRSMDSDGTEIWVPQNTIPLSAEIDRVTQHLHGFIKIVQVRSGYVYLAMTLMTPAGTLRRSFFSLSLDTLMLELLLDGEFDDCIYPYVMAWPPSLASDHGSIGHVAEGSH
uniref:Uncharacterized protein n=1 Tax=Avena sativa TaxID=4498 RepID=A0ACD5Y6B1_AVESA